MDWAHAIAINHSALNRIVAALVAMVGLADGAVTQLPRPVYAAALRILRPAESALRRLIVIAARGIVVKPEAARAMPAGLVLAKKSEGARVSFRLFDPRKRFGANAVRSGAPRIRSLDASPLAPIAQPHNSRGSKPRPEEAPVDAAPLARRLQAVQRALDDLPRQAKRFKRWQARRARMIRPALISPLRPGVPPGYRKTPREEIDLVLRECHALARDVLNDSS